MSANGAAEGCLRSFESKCRAVSATRRKVFEEVTAALDVDTDPLPQHAEGKLATCAAAPARPDPPAEQSRSFGGSPASRTPSEQFSARGRLQQNELVSISSPNGRVGGISSEQWEGRCPPSPCRDALASRLYSAGAADACSSCPVDAAVTTARISPRTSERWPLSTRPPEFVAHRGGTRGHGDAPFRVRSIRAALRDLAGVSDATQNSSPIEHVLARRKRRRRANFFVSSALFLSACAEEAPLPPTPDLRPLVTREDEEHSTIEGGLGDEPEGLSLSRVSCASSASGFRLEPEGAVERLAPLDGALDVPRALNPGQIPSSRTDHELDGNGNGDRNGFTLRTRARSDHQEGVPSEELRGEDLRRVGVGAISCGLVGCGRGGERCPPTRGQQGSSGAFEGCRGDNIDGDWDRCWTQATRGNGKRNTAAGLPSFGFGQGVPPSPLPSPPVPLSPTARRGTFTVRRLPPNIVFSGSSGTLLQQCGDDSCVSGSPDSNKNSMFAGKALAFGVGNEAPTAVSRTAENEAPGEEKVLSPSTDTLSESHSWGSIAGVRGDGGIDETGTGKTPPAVGASSPHARLGDIGQRIVPPETALPKDIATPPDGDVLPKARQLGASVSPPTSPSRENTSSSADCKAGPTSSSPGAQKSIAAQYIGGKTGTQGDALYGTQHPSIEMGISLPSSTGAPRKASATADRDPLKHAQLSKTAVVLAIQRWLRRATLRRKGASGNAKGARQKTREPPPSKFSASSMRPGPREVRMEGALEAHAGVNPSENAPSILEATASVVTHAGNLVRDAIPPYWEYDPIRDRSHVLPPKGLVVTSADPDSFGNAPVSSSPAFAGVRGVSHARPGKKSEKSSDPRGGRDSCRDGVTTPPTELAPPSKAISTDMDQANKAPTSTVVIPGTSASPPPAISLRGVLPSPVVPRRKPDDHLQPSEPEKGTIDPNGDHTGGGKDGNIAMYLGHQALSVSAYYRVRAAQDMPSFSIVALGNRVTPADSGCKRGNGYGLTVQEACLRPSNSQSEGDRAPCRFRESFSGATNRESCQRDAVGLTAAKVPVVRLAPHRPQQENRPSSFAGAFATQVNMNLGGEVGGNPLLDAWGVRNPLLTRSLGAMCCTSDGGGSPYG